VQSAATASAADVGAQDIARDRYEPRPRLGRHLLQTTPNDEEHLIDQIVDYVWLRASGEVTEDRWILGTEERLKNSRTIQQLCLFVHVFPVAGTELSVAADERFSENASGRQQDLQHECPAERIHTCSARIA
jgi:hypothetical protein